MKTDLRFAIKSGPNLNRNHIVVYRHHDWPKNLGLVFLDENQSDISQNLFSLHINKHKPQRPVSH